MIQNQMKGTKEISSLEQNWFVNWAKWKLKKPKYGILSHIYKDQKNVTAIYEVDLV